MGKRKRRQKGEDSIFKRESDNRWVYQRYVDGQSTPIVGYSSVGGTMAQAKAKFAKKLKKWEDEQKKKLEPTKLDLAAFIADWLETEHKPNVEPTSHEPERARFENWLKPACAGMVLDASLTIDAVKTIYARIKEAGASVPVRIRCGKLLRQVLKHAVIKGKILGNPAILVKLPKHKRPKPKPWSKEQAKLFLRATEGLRLRSIFPLAIDSGCRQGELFGLAWNDLNLEDGYATVVRVLCELKGKLWIRDYPKTKSSERRIDLSQGTIDALKAHRDAMKVEGFYRPEGQVFVDTEGGWLRKSNFARNWYYPIFEKAAEIAQKDAEKEKREPIQLPRIKFHNLRHTMVGLLLSDGASAKLVQERAGHGSIVTTLDIYGHLVEGSQKTAAKQMGDLLKQEEE